MGGHGFDRGLPGLGDAEVGDRARPSAARNPAARIDTGRLIQELNNVPEYLAWRDEWLLGIDDIDGDHRQLVALINSLADEQDPLPLTERMNRVKQHLQGHFAREEAFMQAIEFPDADMHASDHAIQVAEFTAVYRELAGSSDNCLDPETLSEIKTWFLNHVVAEDQRFAQFYHRSRIAQQERA